MRIYELEARFDARKSFCVNGKVEELGKFSNTTTRHQKEFRKQFEI